MACMCQVCLGVVAFFLDGALSANMITSPTGFRCYRGHFAMLQLFHSRHELDFHFISPLSHRRRGSSKPSVTSIDPFRYGFLHPVG